MSCSQKPWLTATFEEYQQRLANVLEISESLQTSSNLPEAYHWTSALMFENVAGIEQASEATIKLRDFYNLPQCGIKPLIAERNTTLGKMQLPSQRYLYDVRLMRALIRCQEIILNEQDQQKLQSLTTKKERDLQSSWHKVLVGSLEIKNAIMSENAHFEPNEEHKSAINTWRALAQLSPQKLSLVQYNVPENLNLEATLKQINDFKTPAKLRNDMQLVVSSLPQITQFITEQGTSLACQTRPKDKQKAVWLKNVFNLFFIDKIQPLISKMNGWHYQMEVVLEQSGFIAFQERYMHPNLHHAFLKAVKAHVKAWQSLFERCDMAPVG